MLLVKRILLCKCVCRAYFARLLNSQMKIKARCNAHLRARFLRGKTFKTTLPLFYFCSPNAPRGIPCFWFNFHDFHISGGEKARTNKSAFQCPFLRSIGVASPKAANLHKSETNHFKEMVFHFRRMEKRAAYKPLNSISRRWFILLA